MNTNLKTPSPLRERAGVRMLLFLLFFALHASAASIKQTADSIYQQEQYLEASALYDSLLVSEGPSPEAYYNLGNCHYKMDNMAQAILNYERALRLAPGDDDIRFNLDLARNRTIDRIAPHSDMFLVAWWKGFTNLASSGTWAIMAAVAFALFLLLLFVRMATAYGQSSHACKHGSAAMLLFCITFLLSAWRMEGEMNGSGEAIVMQSATVVRSTPSTTGVELFVLHAGTKVEILDSSISDWHEVQLSDGKKGWIFTADIEKI